MTPDLQGSSDAGQKVGPDRGEGWGAALLSLPPKRRRGSSFGAASVTQEPGPTAAAS